MPVGTLGNVAKRRCDATCPCGERIELEKDGPALLLPDGSIRQRELLSAIAVTVAQR
jgi:hypothetical protein